VRGYCRLASSHSPREFAVGFSSFADHVRYQTKPPAAHALTQAKYNKLEQSFKKRFASFFSIRYGNLIATNPALEAIFITKYYEITRDKGNRHIC